ncbi:MAG TPA: XRE family transcriptional regulator [Longimicrobiaceae bacterium]|nr:XRE family transcriptional regulator [Longimicrobiaceae bacterium]
MPFNPEMVTLAREAREKSQTDLARDVGVKQSTISKIEGGDHVPPPETLAALARALDVPESLFSQPLEYRQLPVSFYRRRVQVSSYKLKAIRARTNFTRMHMRTLLKAVDIPGLRIVHGDARGGTAAASQCARLIRAHWNLPPGPIRNLTAVVENAGIIPIPMDFDAKVDGLSLYDPAEGTPPLLFYNAAAPWDRVRFTIAHELGHIALHHHLAIAETERDYETEAHAFASELLMPEADIKAQLNSLTFPKLAALKSHWGVAMQALVMRAFHLGKITDRQRTYLFMQMSKAGYRTREPVAVTPEPPTLLGEMIGYYLNDLKYSEQRLSADLHMHPVLFRRHYQALSPAGPAATGALKRGAGA